MNLPDNTLLQGGKYKIVRFISAGGFGCTYEGEHVMLHRRVAIKEFYVKDFCNRDETTSQVSVGITSKTALVAKLKLKFIAEAQSLCSLEHPNIVHVFDVFEENGTAYYVMEYIDGQSLNDIIKNNGALSEEKALGFIKQVARALKYVHSQNRLHLDIKPGNIMVDENDRAVLIDFGASKQYDEEEGENTSTLLGKTLGYAPLEQMGNDVVKFLPSTDIYALGATLYKLLTGITPPSASLLASGESLEAMPSTISESTRKAIIKSLQTNKMKRPQSIDEFLNLLETSDNNDSTMIDDIEDDNTIIEEESVKPTTRKKKERKTEPKANKEEKNVVTEESVKNTIGDTEEEILCALPKEKFGAWLWIFLFVLCFCGIEAIFNPLISSGLSALAKGGLVVLGVMQTILAVITLYAFKNRKSDAVFLSKLSLVTICISDLLFCLLVETGTTGIAKMAPFIRGLVTAIVWFVYLLISKRVEAIIPSCCRKTHKKDYIICAVFAILAVYLFAFGNLVIESATSQVANEVFEYNGESVTYSGEVKDGVPNGYGTAQYPRGRYEGTFVDGSRHGKGTFTDIDGGVFTGTFADNDFNEGKYTQIDGTYFEGTFQNQQPYNGIWYEKDGTVIYNIINGEEQTVKKTVRKKSVTSSKAKKESSNQKEEHGYIITGNEFFH